mmetsp:Transcript_35980/g.70794  ORF Transcript_35980/g.70794 Transcript_35980/m.70794 type:complete len:289 (+) Transcript_35980:1886-2752(+)
MDSASVGASDLLQQLRVAPLGKPQPDVVPGCLGEQREVSLPNPLPPVRNEKLQDLHTCLRLQSLHPKGLHNFVPADLPGQTWEVFLEEFSLFSRDGAFAERDEVRQPPDPLHVHGKFLDVSLQVDVELICTLGKFVALVSRRNLGRSALLPLTFECVGYHVLIFVLLLSLQKVWITQIPCDVHKPLGGAENSITGEPLEDFGRGVLEESGNEGLIGRKFGIEVRVFVDHISHRAARHPRSDVVSFGEERQDLVFGSLESTEVLFARSSPEVVEFGSLHCIFVHLGPFR